MENINLEELNPDFKTLKSELDTLESGRTQLLEQISDLRKNINLNSNVLRENNDRMIEIQNILVTENMFNEKTMSIFPDFHLLGANELKVIIKGLDKTDYTSYGKPRIIDLERVVKCILRIKKLYPTWNLHLLQKTGQQDSLPPGNIYEYTFITPEGYHFMYGGIVYKRLNT
jgi:hypothetical protein